jgi:hypothetical protein
MKIVYFVSSSHRYEDAIYFGVGPRFGAAFGWPVLPLAQISSCQCDVGVIDNRLENSDVAAIEQFLSRPAERRFPIFFRISDPDMPTSANPRVKFIFACGDRAGVHFATTYDLEGPFKAYVATLKRSRVVHLPYPYEQRREVDIDLAQRHRRIFLSGANDARLYPLRSYLRSKRDRNPLLRIAIHDLVHPGYPDLGVQLKHSIVRERYVEYAAAYTHFFLCPSVYESEFAKYLECAYAGSVPIGLPPKSLAASVKDCFLTWRGTARELVGALAVRRNEMRLRASRYRDIVRNLRNPEILVRSFETQLSRII